MRKTMKFLHTMGAIGFLGALIALIVLHLTLPEPTDLERFATLRVAMENVAKWILLPSMALVVCSGLLSIAVVRAYQSAGWVWAKALSGVFVFEGTLIYVQAPMELAGERAVAALAGEVPPAELGLTLQPEWGSFWLLGLVGVANVVIGIWRPRFSRRGHSSAGGGENPAESEGGEGGAAGDVTSRGRAAGQGRG